MQIEGLVYVKLITFFSMLFICLMMISSSVFSAERKYDYEAKPWSSCVRLNTQGIKIYSHFCVPLNQKLKVSFLNKSYVLPHAYFVPWLIKLPKEFKITVDGIFNFIFWMPSGRYVEHSWGRFTNSRPEEDGRPSPSKGEFVVFAGLRDPSSFIDKIKNTDDSLSDYLFNKATIFKQNYHLENGKKYFIIDNKELGLIEAWGEMEPELKIYKTNDSEGTPVFIRCDNRGISIYHCSARAHFPQNGIIYQFNFSKEYLSKWRDILSKVTELADSWRQ